ncbi:Uu.00g025820.m01.CDS01 [Anthostomella pinea]|uniref:Uu.00g025820.m01.CDS01 n=1 Tax=Anthostomella pinea TaxID=933095 RepID=A0AAI8V7D7_9PEZI|nr:Uu.00g025820.m01.CDS01 [Anthostomella pinea]
MNGLKHLKQEISLEMGLPQRSSTLPVARREGWAREKPYVLGEKPSRSISLTTKVKGRITNLAVECHPRYRGSGGSNGAEAEAEAEADGYDSDEEDRRNGVPVTVVEANHIQEDRQAALKSKIETLQCRRKELQARFEAHSGRYLAYRRLFLSKRGPVGWSAERWAMFLVLEDDYFARRDRLWQLEERVQKIFTQCMSFQNHAELTSMRNGGHWHRQGAMMVWSMSDPAVEKEIAGGGGGMPLVYNGIDYNAIAT